MNIEPEPTEQVVVDELEWRLGELIKSLLGQYFLNTVLSRMDHSLHVNS